MHDHMAREEYYYLIELYMSDPENVTDPSCDPGPAPGNCTKGKVSPDGTIEAKERGA